MNLPPVISVVEDTVLLPPIVKINDVMYKVGDNRG